MSEAPKTWVQYDKTLPYIEDREPHQKPISHLIKDGENSYKVVDYRRPSKMLLVNKLRDDIDSWRDAGYPGISNTTRVLLTYWFEEDHLVNGERFKFWFCQREAIETLIYLYEVKKFKDLKPVIKTYSENFRKDLFKDAVEFVETLEGKRKLIRYFPELEQEGEQDLPPENLLRYAFKMATGSGKTMVIVWSYFNKKKEINSNLSDNFLILAPNVIVYERLEKDFSDSKIFHEFPLIPPYLKSEWNLKVTLRGDSSPLNPNGNLIINNIHQLYESREDRWAPENIVDEILGRKPQKDLTKSPVTLLEQIKRLDSLIVLNDEAHHVHREDLKWNETLMGIHNSLPEGLTLWLDFSATPKTQTGTYYPWIIVDYPLAQAVEDRIVKAPLIVHRVDKEDPENISRDNVVQKYGDWITAALTRWKEHFKVYKQVGKKPVLFIMAGKNEYADRIADAIKKQKDNLGLKKPDEEVLVIHTETKGETKGEIRKSELEDLRRLARDIDEPHSKVKIIVSVLMLREGWDVQNVTVVLGLRPFTSKAEILPEQAVGRGLRIINGISPDHTQTLEVMGTSSFEDFVRELEKEGVGINTVKEPPPLPVTISPEKSRLKYDIEIPQTGFRFSHNYKRIETIDPLKIPSIYNSEKLEEERKILIRMEFPITETEVHMADIIPEHFLTPQELLSHLTNEVMKRARFTCSFSEVYPIVEKYVTERCFEVKVDLKNEKLIKQLNDISVREAIIDLLSKEFTKVTVETKDVIEMVSEPLRLSDITPFTWRRKHLRCNKTVFNFVAVFNDFEAEFARFLDKSEDVESFSALAGKFKIDYLKSNGAIGFYWPDFACIHRIKESNKFWIIETKGREYEDTNRKEKAIEKWCEDVTKQTKMEWKYMKVLQSQFSILKDRIKTFEDLKSSLGDNII